MWTALQTPSAIRSFSARPLLNVVNFQVVNIAVRDAVLRGFRSDVSRRSEAVIPQAKCGAVNA
jgi:hypothetical protein